jgi:Zn-dependent peptidase ImmA (M78 family)
MGDIAVAEEAKQLAKKFGQVRKTNFLAHSIREIEMEIFYLHNINYFIITRISEHVPKSRCHFAIQGCTIFLPLGANDMDIKEVRLRLAHELGHIVGNIEKLKDLAKTQEIYSPEEEIFASVFAYQLLWEKSESYKNDPPPYADFIYKNQKELAAAVLRIAGENGEQVQKALERALPKI